MPDLWVALATLIFAGMAGVGSVVRCYQNQRYWRWVQRQAKLRKK
jgi:hypothetical protein